MANEPNDPTAHSGLHDFVQSFEHYGKVMFFECYDVLDNTIAAEEAAGEAVIKALQGLPKEITTSLEAWLRTVARHTAIDMLKEMIRKRNATKGQHNSRLENPDEPFRVSQIQMDTRLFLGRMVGLLDESFREDVGLYFDVLFGSFTEVELARQRGIPHNALKDRRERGRRAGREAAAVVCLTTDAGDGPNRCSGPLDLARGRKYTPELLKAVKAHIAECERCQNRRDDKEALLKTIFVIPLVAMVWQLLDRLRMNTPAKVTLTASAVAVAAITLIPGITHPEPDPLPPPALETTRLTGTKGIEPAPLSTTPPPTTPPTTTASPKTDRSATQPPPEPPAPPPVTTQPGTTTTTTSPPDPTEQPRDYTPPTVVDSWIEHNRIAATKNGTCPTDEPTSSAVRVSVDRRAASAELLVTGQGRTISQPMTDSGDGIVWLDRVGSFLDDDSYGSVTLTVRVIGTNGATVTRRLGEICVTPCRWNSSE